MKGDILEEFVKEFGSVHENKPNKEKFRDFFKDIKIHV